MAISEAARSDLYNGLRDVLGTDRAEILMSAIPLHDLDEVATKGDLAELRAEFKGDITELRAELKEDIAGLRVEFKGDLADLRKSMTTWFLTLATANIGAVVGVALLVR